MRLLVDSVDCELILPGIEGMVAVDVVACPYVYLQMFVLLRT
jgi:hypothetical protein